MLRIKARNGFSNQYYDRYDQTTKSKGEQGKNFGHLWETKKWFKPDIFLTSTCTGVFWSTDTKNIMGRRIILASGALGPEFDQQKYEI